MDVYRFTWKTLGSLRAHAMALKNCRFDGGYLGAVHARGNKRASFFERKGYGLQEVRGTILDTLHARREAHFRTTPVPKITRNVERRIGAHPVSGRIQTIHGGGVAQLLGKGWILN